LDKPHAGAATEPLRSRCLSKRQPPTPAARASKHWSRANCANSAGARRPKPSCETSPDDFDTLTGLAQIARDNADRSGSLALLERAAKTYPDHAGLKGLMASDLRELGRLHQAQALLREVPELYPGRLDALMALGQMARGRGDRAGALTWFQPAAAAHPEHMGCKIEAAIDLRELDRTGEAERLLRQVLELDPQHVDALAGLAHVAWRRGDRQTALTLFQGRGGEPGSPKPAGGGCGRVTPPRQRQH
jgi:tetratricopeptide (TPR) repeat protein